MNKYLIAFVFGLLCFFASSLYSENPTIVTAEGNVTNKGSRTGRVILDTKPDVSFNSVTLGGEQRTTWPTGGGGGSTGLYASATLNFGAQSVIGTNEDKIITIPGVTPGMVLQPAYPTNLPPDSAWNCFVVSNDSVVVRRTCLSANSAYTNTFGICATVTNFSLVSLLPSGSSVLGMLIVRNTNTQTVSSGAGTKCILDVVQTNTIPSSIMTWNTNGYYGVMQTSCWMRITGKAWPTCDAAIDGRLYLSDTSLTTSVEQILMSSTDQIGSFSVPIYVTNGFPFCIGAVIAGTNPKLWGTPTRQAVFCFEIFKP